MHVRAVQEPEKITDISIFLKTETDTETDTIQRYSRMGWAAMSNKTPGCHLANA